MFCEGNEKAYLLYSFKFSYLGFGEMSTISFWSLNAYMKFISLFLGDFSQKAQNFSNGVKSKCPIVLQWDIVSDF